MIEKQKPKKISEFRVTGITDGMRQLEWNNEIKLCHNTTLRKDPGEGTISVVFDLTTIVKYTPSGLIILDSGGHKTPNTMKRIKRCLPEGYDLHSIRRAWKLQVPTSVPGEKTIVDFQDGMTIEELPQGYQP